jgi:hypothetical protein
LRVVADFQGLDRRATLRRVSLREPSAGIKISGGRPLSRTLATLGQETFVLHGGAPAVRQLSHHVVLKCLRPRRDALGNSYFRRHGGGHLEGKRRAGGVGAVGAMEAHTSDGAAIDVPSFENNCANAAASWPLKQHHIKTGCFVAHRLKSIFGVTPDPPTGMEGPDITGTSGGALLRLEALAAAHVHCRTQPELSQFQQFYRNHALATDKFLQKIYLEAKETYIRKAAGRKVAAKKRTPTRWSGRAPDATEDNGCEPEPTTRAVAVPIYEAVAYVFRQRRARRSAHRLYPAGAWSSGLTAREASWSERRRRMPALALSVVAFLASVGLAAGSLVVFGADIKGTRHALEITARFSYLWFWPAYAGGALAYLLGTRFRHGREFGLAFAAVHSIHLMLVLWLYEISPRPPISLGGAVFFGIGAGFMYLLAILSIKSVMQTLNPWLWRSILLVGMEYIEYAFLTDFWVDLSHPISLHRLVGYLPFMLLGLFGTTVRLLRWSVKLVQWSANAFG